MTIAFGRRAAIGAGVAALSAPRIAAAQAPHRVRLTMDWALHGSYAFAVAGERTGIFRKHNVDMAVNRGFGSGRVPVDVAANTYDLAFGDLIRPALMADSCGLSFGHWG